MFSYYDRAYQLWRAAQLAWLRLWQGGEPPAPRAPGDSSGPPAEPMPSPSPAPASPQAPASSELPEPEADPEPASPAPSQAAPGTGTETGTETKTETETTGSPELPAPPPASPGRDWTAEATPEAAPEAAPESRPAPVPDSAREPAEEEPVTAVPAADESIDSEVPPAAAGPVEVAPLPAAAEAVALPRVRLDMRTRRRGRPRPRPRPRLPRRPLVAAVAPTDHTPGAGPLHADALRPNQTAEVESPVPPSLASLPAMVMVFEVAPVARRALPRRLVPLVVDRLPAPAVEPWVTTPEPPPVAEPPSPPAPLPVADPVTIAVPVAATIPVRVPALVVGRLEAPALCAIPAPPRISEAITALASVETVALAPAPPSPLPPPLPPTPPQSSPGGVEPPAAAGPGTPRYPDAPPAVAAVAVTAVEDHGSGRDDDKNNDKHENKHEDKNTNKENENGRESESESESEDESGNEDESPAAPAGPIGAVIDEETEDRRHRLRILEALLFASAEPVDQAALAERLGINRREVLALLAALQGHYAPRGVTLVQREDRWAFRTATDLAPLLCTEEESRRKLSRAAIETLAIIAYHQPVTRAEIESIRGVATSKGTLDLLMEANWIRPGKRRETPGRPLTWITTDHFLDYFGLTSLRDLPGVDELKASGLLDQRPMLAPIAGGLAGKDREDGDGNDGTASAASE